MRGAQGPSVSKSRTDDLQTNRHALRGETAGHHRRRLPGQVEGIAERRPIGPARISRSRWNLDTNLKGAFTITKAFARPLRKADNARIINIASVVGLVGNAGQANYAASKAGLIGFTKSVAKELAKSGITVNAIAPGFIATDMTAELSDKVKDAIKANIPMGELGVVDDIAGAALYLASPAARYVTGQVLTVDGGMVM